MMNWMRGAIGALVATGSVALAAPAAQAQTSWSVSVGSGPVYAAPTYVGYRGYDRGYYSDGYRYRDGYRDGWRHRDWDRRDGWGYRDRHWRGDRYRAGYRARCYKDWRYDPYYGRRVKVRICR